MAYIPCHIHTHTRHRLWAAVAFVLWVTLPLGLKQIHPCNDKGHLNPSEF